MNAIRNVAVLGATGSIGTDALDVLAQHPDRFRVSVLAAHRDAERLAALCARHRPDLAIVADAQHETALARRLMSAGSTCDVTSGDEALRRAAGSGLCDIVVVAMPGPTGLNAALAAACAGKRVLLADPGMAAVAGQLLVQAAELSGGQIVPLSPGLQAIVQCLRSYGYPTVQADVSHLTLVSSGGPLFGRRRADLMALSPEQLVSPMHRVRTRKAMVNAASLMGVGLHALAIRNLFGMAGDRIAVQVDSRGLLQAVMQRNDGSVVQVMSGADDMRAGIIRALLEPPPSDPAAVAPPSALEPPDLNTFRCLALACQALRQDGDAAVILNAANEVAMEAFLAGSLPFLSIADLVEQVLMELPAQSVVDIQTLSERDRAAHAAARRVLRNAC